jgi:DNA-binding PadR family transcriptional regulator
LEGEFTFFVYGKSYSGRRLQKALALKILSEKGPMSAYELLKELKAMGFKASPSSVYNLLRQLEEEGSVKKEGEVYVALTEPEADEGVERALKALEAPSRRRGSRSC